MNDVWKTQLSIRLSLYHECETENVYYYHGYNRRLGVYYKFNGSAIIYSSGDKYWTVNGKSYRISYKGVKEWWADGKVRKTKYE